MQSQENKRQHPTAVTASWLPSKDFVGLYGKGLEQDWQTLVENLASQSRSITAHKAIAISGNTDAD